MKDEPQEDGDDQKMLRRLFACRLIDPRLHCDCELYRIAGKKMPRPLKRNRGGGTVAYVYCGVKFW